MSLQVFGKKPELGLSYRGEPGPMKLAHPLVS